MTITLSIPESLKPEDGRFGSGPSKIRPEQIAALDAGAETIIVGLGGSATNDAGCGLLQALGVRLLDHDGRDVRPGGAALAEVERVDLSGLDRRLGDVHVIAACDVTNPLTGPEGASAVFGPQKGASREDVTL